MTVADNSQSSFSYVVETTAGTTPSTPTLITLPRKGGTGFTQTFEELPDGSIYADQQERASSQGNNDVTGTIEVEFRKGDYDTLLEGALRSTWATNVLKIGSTQKSFTFQDSQADVGQYFVTRGGVISSLAMSIDVGASNPVTATFGMTALTHTLVQTDIATSTTAPSINQPMTPFSSAIQIGNQGGALADICVTSLDFSLTRSNEIERCIGSRSGASVISATNMIEGSFTIYLRNETTYNRFVNETKTAIEVPIDDPTAANPYVFLFPNAKIISAETIAADGSGGRIVTCGFKAFYDPTEESAMVITRTA